MVKLNIINQNACQINSNREMYTISHQFIKILTKMTCLGPYEIVYFFTPYVYFLPNSVF